MSLLAIWMAIHARGDIASQPSPTLVAWFNAHPNGAHLLRFSFETLFISPACVAWVSALDVKSAYPTMIGWEQYEAASKSGLGRLSLGSPRCRTRSSEREVFLRQLKGFLCLSLSRKIMHLFWL